MLPEGRQRPTTLQTVGGELNIFRIPDRPRFCKLITIWAGLVPTPVEIGRKNVKYKPKLVDVAH